MRNYLFLVSIVFFLLACGGSKSPEDCKIAEGSQWSQLKKNCVKLADTKKFTLKSADASGGKMGIVYIVYGGSRTNKAETLFSDNTSTGVMVRSDDLKPWRNTQWSLELTSGHIYAMKKNHILMYYVD